MTVNPAISRASRSRGLLARVLGLAYAAMETTVPPHCNAATCEYGWNRSSDGFKTRSAFSFVCRNGLIAAARFCSVAQIIHKTSRAKLRIFL